MTVAMVSFEVFFAAHVLQQPHDVGGAEEVRADHVLGPAGGRGDLVGIQRRGVGCQHRARLHHLVQPGEDFLLHRHVLEHGLDDDVRVADGLVGGDRVEKAHALLDLLSGHAALLRRVFVVPADDADATVERFLRHLQNRHRNADIQEVHGDTATHGATANDRGLADLLRRNVLADIGIFATSRSPKKM